MEVKFLLLSIVLCVLGVNSKAIDGKSNGGDSTYTCQNIVAYFNGTFQWTPNPSFNFDAQFQLKFYVNQDVRRIYFGIDKWNQTLLTKKDDKLEIGFDSIFPANVDYHSCKTPGENCSIPFIYQKTRKNINVGTKKGDWFFGLLEFPTFFNSFTLNNTIGKCTKHQGDFPDYPAPLEPSLVSYCVCCDEYKPDPKLGCPKNPWA